MLDVLDILQCPRTQRPLRCVSENELAADGGPSYEIRDAIARLLPGGAEGLSRKVQDFYSSVGWEKDEQGLLSVTKTFLDTRKTSLDFTRKCIARLGKYFRRGGRYLLDAGSGAIGHDELLAYGGAFERRVCVDLSASALQAARSRLGDRGVYLQADVISLPLKSGSMDAITCNHVLYQIPGERQASALRELWRVLKPGGVAVVVYLWPYAPLAHRLERLARRFGAAKSVAAEAPAPPLPDIEHVLHPLSWFREQDLPFKFRLDSFRVIDNTFMRNYVSDDRRGRAFLSALLALQSLAPGFCGKYGAVPALVFRKGQGESLSPALPSETGSAPQRSSSHPKAPAALQRVE